MLMPTKTVLSLLCTALPLVLKVVGSRTPLSLRHIMQAPGPPPPPWANEAGGAEVQVQASHKFSSELCEVIRRWPQSFAKVYPEVDQHHAPINLAVHMPYARWMHVKWRNGTRKWGWGCEICQCELTDSHLTSKRHLKSAGNRY